jgi:hypothetical protein
MLPHELTMPCHCLALGTPSKRTCLAFVLTRRRLYLTNKLLPTHEISLPAAELRSRRRTIACSYLPT